MSELHVEVSGVAAEQIRVAETWWRTNRPNAPNAIREELERASALVAAQPDIGSRARNVKLAGVRRIHLSRIRYHLYTRQRSTKANRDSGLLALKPRRQTADLTAAQHAMEPTARGLLCAAAHR